MSEICNVEPYRIVRLRGRSLPLLNIPLYADAPCETRRRRRSHVTLPGTGKGRKPGNAGRRWPAEVLTQAEVRRLIDACPATGPYSVRNPTIIVVLWRCGLRVAELCGLDVRDIDFDRGTVLVRHGKGDKRRTVGIDRFGLDAVEDWLTIRAEFAPADGPLFVTLEHGWQGNRIGTAYVREMLHRLGKRAGIAKRVHPHGLRHTHAFELAEEGVPLGTIQLQLGHANQAITAHYIDHLNPVNAIRAVQARSVR